MVRILSFTLTEPNSSNITHFSKVRHWGFILLAVTQDTSKYNNLSHQGLALTIHLRDKFKSNKMEKIIPPSLSFEVVTATQHILKYILIHQCHISTFILTTDI